MHNATGKIILNRGDRVSLDRSIYPTIGGLTFLCVAEYMYHEHGAPVAEPLPPDTASFEVVCSRVVFFVDDDGLARYIGLEQFDDIDIWCYTEEEAEELDWIKFIHGIDRAYIELPDSYFVESMMLEFIESIHDYGQTGHEITKILKTTTLP